MKQFLILFFGFCLSFGALAQEKNDALFAKAQTAFDQKDYETSAKIFNDLIQTDSLNPTLHYNLGTAYLKMQKTGLSIFHLEKALKLRPDYESARINLNFAEKLKTKVTKGNLPVPQQQMLYSVFDFLTANTWAYFAIACMLVGVILLIVYRLTNSATAKKITFAGGVFAVLVSIGSYFISRNQSDYLLTNHYVIVKTKDVSLMEEPRNIAKITTVLDEGSKGFIKEETNQWVKIQLPNDTLGWVAKNNVLQY